MRHILAAVAILLFATTTRAGEGESESKTTISGKAFADISYSQTKNAGNTTDKSVGVDVKRFYFTVEHTFNDVWAARFTSDIGDLNVKYGSTSATNAIGSSSKLDVFVKNAYIEAKIVPELALRLGAAGLPWISLEEQLQGFRYVESTYTDRIKFANSADWGLHAGGKFAGGMVAYAISVSNGRGYADPTRSQTPSVEALLSVAPVQGLTVAVGGEVGKLGQDVVGTATPNTAARVSAVAGWVDGGLRAGAEGFYAKNRAAAIVKGGAEDSAIGGSVWAGYEFVPAVTGFGRLDYTKPNKDTTPDLKQVYFNLGVEYKPVKPVALALVFKHQTQDAGGPSVESNEFGIFGQYAF